MHQNWQITITSKPWWYEKIPEWVWNLGADSDKLGLDFQGKHLGWLPIGGEWKYPCHSVQCSHILYTWKMTEYECERKQEVWKTCPTCSTEYDPGVESMDLVIWAYVVCRGEMRVILCLMFQRGWRNMWLHLTPLSMLKWLMLALWWGWFPTSNRWLRARSVWFPKPRRWLRASMSISRVSPSISRVGSIPILWMRCRES